MNRRSSTIIVRILIALGLFGLVYTLFTQPSRLFVQLGMIALFVGVIFLIYKFVMKRRMGGSEYTAYIRAAKQSKRRFNEPKQQKPTIAKVIDSKKGSSTTKKTFGSSTNKKKKSSHLTVIEGKKGKKKNRALF